MTRPLALLAIFVVLPPDSAWADTCAHGSMEHKIAGPCPPGMTTIAVDEPKKEEPPATPPKEERKPQPTKRKTAVKPAGHAHPHDHGVEPKEGADSHPEGDQVGVPGTGRMSDDKFHEHIDQIKEDVENKFARAPAHVREKYRNLVKGVHDKFHNDKDQWRDGMAALTDGDMGRLRNVVDTKTDLDRQIYRTLRSGDINWGEFKKIQDEAKIALDRDFREGGHAHLAAVGARYGINPDNMKVILEKGNAFNTAMGQMMGAEGDRGESAVALHNAFHEVFLTVDPKDGGTGGLPSSSVGQHNSNLINSSPNNPFPLIFGGKQDLASGDPRSAWNRANQALALDPKNAEALALRAAANYEMGQYRDANKDAGAALGIDPNNKMAVGVYNLTQERGSGHVPASLGSLGQGDADSGVRGFAGKSAALPDMKDLSASAGFARQAGLALGVRDYNAAIDQAGRAIAANPQNAQAFNFRAMAYNGLRQYDKALKDAVAGLKIAPRNGPLLNTKAYALNKLKNYREALEAANLALEINPRDAAAWANKAYALGGLGDREGMLAALRMAASLDPRFETSLASALQTPQDSDVLFLFPGEEGGAVAKNEKAPSRGRSMGVIGVSSAVGGILIALGVLPLILPSLTQRLKALMGVAASATSPPTPLPAAANGALSPGAPMNGHAPGLLRGHYEIVRQIGLGGMGVVYEGRDVSLERRVAIKKMRPELAGDAREREKFLTEAKLVAALRHARIVDIYDIVEEGNDVYLVFEHVAGKTLHEVLTARGRLSFPEAAHIIRGIVSALEFAHGRGVIHRDLKPSNVMVDREGDIRVMDFGIARLAKDAMTRYVMTNTIVGTPPYMAPEQEQGVVCRQSDLYSLAVVFYELLSGRLPFVGTGSGMLMNKMNMTYVPVSKLVTGLPPAVDEFFAKAFAADPDRRFSAAAELSQALDGLTALRS